LPEAGIDIGADESAGETWAAAAARFHVRTDGSDTADGAVLGPQPRRPCRLPSMQP